MVGVLGFISFILRIIKKNNEESISALLYCLEYDVLPYIPFTSAAKFVCATIKLHHLKLVLLECDFPCCEFS